MPYDNERQKIHDMVLEQVAVMLHDECDAVKISILKSIELYKDMFGNNSLHLKQLLRLILPLRQSKLVAIKM